MIAKDITLKELKKAIDVSFEGDKKIVELYDPNVPVETVQDVKNNVWQKISELNVDLKLKGVFEKGELTGYFVFWNKLLISFGMEMKHRSRRYLRKFFALIKEEMGKEICCRLWSKNERAINWLIKNGMVLIHEEDNITHLIYSK